MDRYLGTAPVKVEGGLYVVARYILKALENYFYENFDEFQSGKKRKVSASLKKELESDIKKFFNYDSNTKRWLGDFLTMSRDDLDNVQEIIKNWEDFSKERNTGLTRLGSKDSTPDQQKIKIEQLLGVLKQLNKLFKRVESMQKELGSPLIKYLKNEADKRMIGEQIENKLELLILEEIKRIKNG